MGTWRWLATKCGEMPSGWGGGGGGFDWRILQCLHHFFSRWLGSVRDVVSPGEVVKRPYSPPDQSDQ